MVWPVTVSHSATSSKVIHCPLSAALQLLHDPPSLLELNPLVLSKTSDPRNPALYSVTDKLVVFGYFQTQTTFTCIFNDCGDGVDVVVNAAAGTTVKTKWRAWAVEGGTEVREDVFVQGLFFFMPFIVGTLAQSHHMLLENLAVKLEYDCLNRPLKEQPPATSSSSASSTNSLSITSITLALVFSFQYANIHHLLVVLLTAGGLSAVVWLFMRSKDPYGLFHLSLNKIPDNNPDTPPRTEWLNMGYWRDTNVFPEACEALALKLVQAAKCKNRGNVLDVGHGTGESLILLLSHPSIPRPLHITGITSLVTHHQRSKDRVARLQTSQQRDLEVDVTLYQGDAIYRPTSTCHPLSPSGFFFDTILALDCAYHFNTRRTFLHQSFDRLAPGGRIALADICFSPSALQRHRNQFITSLLRLMPKENMISTEQYVRDLEGMGYVDVMMEDVTADVFPGFLKFLRQKGWGWSIFGSIMGWYVGAGARFVIISGGKGNSH